MATLHLLCGLPCSGKTTLARKLERDLPALRLSPDEWLIALYGSEHDPITRPDDAKKRANVEALQFDLGVRAVQMGFDAVLENGFWSRSERDQVRAAAASRGVATRLHFLDVPRDELVRRLTRRNAALPNGVFRVTEGDLDAWTPLFEPPTEDELR